MSEKVDLRRGYPDPKCLEGCRSILLQASQTVLGNCDLEQSIFQYQNQCPQYVQQLESFLSKEYGPEYPVKREDLIATGGASQGLHLVVTSLFKNGDLVFVEELSYYHGIELFRQFDMKIVPVPMDKEGILTEKFEELLQNYLQNKPEADSRSNFLGMCYLIPTFHNPTGIVYSADRCRKLIQLARKYKILLVCDDVYNLLYYTGSQAPPRLLSFDNEDDADYRGNVVSNCTFTKILAPGMRLGWIEAKPPVLNLIKKSFLIRSGGCINQYSANIISSALEQGLIQNNLQRIREKYTRKMGVLVRALKENLPSNCKIRAEAKGGYFVFVDLPDGLTTADIDNEEVNFLPGERCSPDQRCCNGIRLSMSYCEESQIEPGIRRLCSDIKDKCALSANKFWCSLIFIRPT